MNIMTRLESVSAPLLMAFLSILSFFKQSLHAEIKGRLDAGPTYAHIDVLESGKTIHRMDMPAVKGEAAINFYKGFCLKPNFIYGSNNGSLFNAGIGLGYYIPLTEYVCITPTVGWAYADIRTHIDLPMFGLFHVKERFRSYAPYLSLELTIKFTKCWRMTALYQYSWCRTHTTINHLVSNKSHSDGPNYGLMIERDINEDWSIYVGGAYNISLSKEKHGLRAYGAKIGIVRWFGFKPACESD